MMRTTARPVWALLIAAIPAAAASAQPVQLPAGARRVDPGVSDVGALGGVSRSDLRRDLRHDSGFGSVYQLQLPQPMGMPGSGSSVFLRIDGGITAVFPESVYWRGGGSGKGGTIPLVPPGTTFYIGRLPESLTGPATPLPPRSHLFVDLNAAAQPTAAEPRRSPTIRTYNAPPGQPRPDAPSLESTPPPPESPGPSLFTDEAYRQRAIARLIDRAAAIR